MQRKKVMFIADSLDNAHKFQQVLSSLDVEVAAGTSLQFPKLLTQNSGYDLVIYEVQDDVLSTMAKVESILLENQCLALLVVLSAQHVSEFRLPAQLLSDFIVHGATHAECAVRISQLLWPGTENTESDFFAIDNMTINLASYQVTIGGEPLDLTYLEYALLSFLVTHPGRTYSRDALLRRVWGFDYYGGSRTVDVHVRRIRAKLGPELAQRLETIRGVGYLWSA